MENVEPLWSEPSVQYDNFVIFEAKLLSVDIRQKVEREGVEWLNECEIRERPFWGSICVHLAAFQSCE